MNQLPIYQKLLEQYTHEQIEKEFFEKFGLTLKEINAFLINYRQVEYNKDNILKYVNVHSFFALENKFLHYAVKELKLLEYMCNNQNVIDTVRNICKNYNELKNEDLLYYSKHVVIYELNLERFSYITDNVLERMPYLKKLSLYDNNNISDNAIQYFREIEYLNLHHNEKITDKGIKNMSLMKKLNLSGNKKITDNGIKLMTEMQHLDLSYNKKITDKGIKLMTFLTFLQLHDNNNISDKRIKKLPLVQVDRSCCML